MNNIIYVILNYNCNIFFYSFQHKKFKMQLDNK